MSDATTELAPLDKTTRAPVTMGIAPKTLEEAWRFSQYIAKSDDMIAKAYRGSAEKVLVAIQMGMELGLLPLQALQSIAVINGRASLWGDALLALVISSPAYSDHDEYYEVEVNARKVERRDGVTAAEMKVDTTCAVCTFVRRGKATPVTRRFSVGQARKAGYLGEGTKSGKEGPWQTHPDRMLAMRARTFAARDCFADVLRGITSAEEARDTPDLEPEPIRMVRRVSEAPAPAPEPEPSPIPPPPPSAAVVLPPLGVKRVEHLIGGPCAFLADGTQVWLSSIDDANEVEKFVGTSHRLRFSVVPVEGVPQQQTAISFEIAE